MLKVSSVSLATMVSTSKGDVFNTASKVENSSVSQRLFRDQTTDNGKVEYTMINILESSSDSLSMSLVIVTDVYTIKPEELMSDQVQPVFGRVVTS